jgi:pyruvate,water dikinase
MAEKKIWICDDEPSARYPVWTRGNAGEVFVEAVSPLTWSLLGRHALEPGWREGFYEMGAFAPEDFKPAGQPEVAGCFGGYIYINMAVTRVMAVRVPGLTVEAMDKSLFGDYAGAPPYRADPRDENASRTAAVGAWLQTLFTVDPKPATDADRTRLDALLARQPQLGILSDAQVIDYFRSLASEVRLDFKRHVLNTYGANVLASIIAQMSAAVGVPELAAQVTAAVGDVDSAGQSFELWRLSRTVRASPSLSAAFDAGVEGLLDRMHAWNDPAVERFLEEWNLFLQHWGFIGPSVWDFRSPTYRSDPGLALRMLDRLRAAPDRADPVLRTAQLQAQRERAVAEISHRLAEDAAAQGQFLAAASEAGNYLAARERTKMHCTLIIDHMRNVIRTLGQRFVQRGQLQRWEHILLLNDDEMNAFLASPGNYADVIVERAQRLALLMAREPPFVFEGDPPPLSAFPERTRGTSESASEGVQLTGMGVSPGRHTGRARVIASLHEDSELEPGEVIVAAITDSSWGPLFLTAGAVVVETGATVSHAAIVARELGIPAAVSVAGATRRIPDGAIVTVDGNTGVVIVH